MKTCKHPTCSDKCRRLKVKKKKEKSVPQLLGQLQKIFNAWIRERDSKDGYFQCISCSKILPVSKMNAGHYVPQKNSSLLRIDEENVNGECEGCNCFDKFHLVGYRKNLVEKIGEERVQWLDDNCRSIKKWTRTEVEFLIRKYGRVNP